MNKYRITADSSADTLSLDGADFCCAPLKIVTSCAQYTDDATLDVEDMVNTLANYKGKSSTSCPSPEDWLKAFDDADRVFCVTITGTLSGSYNAASVAKQIYETDHPDRQVFVINSLSAGPELKLIIEKLREFINCGMDYDKICDAITEYTKGTGLLFMLESMKNLANNGRVSPLVAKAAGLLGIRVVGKASDVGDLQPLDKCRGVERAILAIAKRMIENGFCGGKVRIAHCFNTEAALMLKNIILEKFASAQIEIYKARGLCSFYAEKGGMLVGYEKGRV